MNKCYLIMHNHCFRCQAGRRVYQPHRFDRSDEHSDQIRMTGTNRVGSDRFSPFSKLKSSIEQQHHQLTYLITLSLSWSPSSPVASMLWPAAGRRGYSVQSASLSLATRAFGTPILSTLHVHFRMPSGIHRHRHHLYPVVRRK